MTEEPGATKITPQEQQATLKQFFNALRDRPLSPGDSFYVPYLEERPEEDHISFLTSEIRMSEAAGVILLSGHRGTGKSTELRRLKHYLEESDCVVLLSDMQDYMNMTTRVELTDFFISAMGALAEEVERRYGGKVLEERFWQRIVGFLQLVMNPLRGRSVAEARESLERAVALALHQLQALVPLAYLGAKERRYADYEELVRRLGSDHDFVGLMQLVSAFSTGDRSAR